MNSARKNLSLTLSQRKNRVVNLDFAAEDKPEHKQNQDYEHEDCKRGPESKTLQKFAQNFLKYSFEKLQELLKYRFHRRQFSSAPAFILVSGEIVRKVLVLFLPRQIDNHLPVSHFYSPGDLVDQLGFEPDRMFVVAFALAKVCQVR